MKNISFYIYLLLSITGCSSMYIPSPKPTPLFEKKGEVQIEAGTSINSPFVIAGYAFSEKYALITSGSLSYRNFMNVYERPHVEFDIFPFPNGAFAHRAIELGIGRYNMRPLSRQKLELFTGIVYGNAKEEKDRKNNYYQCFLQANIGKRKKYFELGGSFRLGFSLFDYKSPKIDYSDDFRRDYILHKTFEVAHAETLFFMKFGGEHLKGCFRVGGNAAIPFLSSSNREIIWRNGDLNRNYTMFHLSIGLSYSFGNKFKQ